MYNEKSITIGYLYSIVLQELLGTMLPMNDTEAPKGIPQINRRQVLQMLALAGAGAGLSLVGCGESTPIPPPNNLENNNNLVSRELSGEYSDFIMTNKLVPKTIMRLEGENDKDYLQRQGEAGLAYLGNFRDALSRSELRNNLLDLSDYRINSSENYPVSIPEDWDIVDVVNVFLADVQSGKTKIVGEPNYKGLLSTRNNFPKAGSEFSRTSTITIGTGLLGNGNFQQDNGDNYTHITDAEAAILLLHEFTHALQGEMALTLVKNAQVTVGSSAEMEQVVMNLDREKQAAMANQYGYDAQFNELQANTVHLLFLNTLNELNGTDSSASRPNFPGTALVDPSDIAVAQIQASGNPNFSNAYKAFTETVLTSKDALDPAWIQSSTVIEVR
jgi:hypothetical protein